MLDLDNHYYIKRIAIDLSKAFSRSRVSISLGNVSSGEGSGKLVRWWRKLFSTFGQMLDEVYVLSASKKFVRLLRRTYSSRGLELGRIILTSYSCCEVFF